MMFSMEKCLGPNGSGSVEEAGLYAGGGENLVKEGVPSDEVASAVAAVSDEIGDILKDELGDADRADRIGAELADLSAELGLLAGLADTEQPPDFPSLFEIAMGHRDSGSGSSSSSWSGGRRGGPRRNSRPQRAPRRRPIAKGKDMSRRRSAAAKRAACMRLRRVEVVSDASDVGADSDSDDQWTELDDATGSSDSSSLKDTATGGQVECNYQQQDSNVEAPALGQFLLPLMNDAPHPDHFLIRHEDILQLLASAEENAREEFPAERDTPLDPRPDIMSIEGMFIMYEEPPVSPQEEAALLHYVCEGGAAVQSLVFEPLAEWLMGVYHSWCEISALMYTLIGTNMTIEMASPAWVYRARLGCHCRLCLCTCAAIAAQLRLLHTTIHALAHERTANPSIHAVKHTEKSYDTLRVQYNNAFRALMGLPRYCSASGIFAQANIDSFSAILRKRTASLIRSVRASFNTLIQLFAWRMDYECPIMQHWNKLHVVHSGAKPEYRLRLYVKMMFP